MKSLSAFLLLGASVLPAPACDSADPAKNPDFGAVAPIAGSSAGTAKADTKTIAPAPHAPVAPAPKSTGKTREARRTPPPAHLFM